MNEWEGQRFSLCSEGVFQYERKGNMRMNNGLRFLGDVPILIDGCKVSNSGRIRLAGGEPRSLNYSIYTKQLGEKVPVKVYRDGTVVETEIPVAKKDMRSK